MIKNLVWTSYIFMWSFAGIYLMPNIQSLGELLFFFLAGLCLIRFWRSTNDGVIFCIFMILVFHLFRIVLNAIDGVDLHDVFRNAHRIFLYFVPIVFGVILRKYEDVKTALMIVAWMLIISATSYFIVRIGISDLGYLVEEDAASGAMRIRHILFEFIYIFGILFLSLSLSANNNKRKTFYAVLYLISLAVIVDSYFRSLLIGFLFCTLVVLLLSAIKHRKVLSKSFKTLFFIGIGGFIFLCANNPGILVARISEQLVDEVQTQTGTFLSRMVIWNVRSDAVMADNRLALGYGFVSSKQDEEALLADRILNPVMMDSDNGYASLLVAYGVLGFIVFGVFYAVLLIDSIKLYRFSDGELASIAMTVIAVLFSNLLISFFKDFFLWVYSVLSFGLLIGIYLSMKRINCLKISILKGN